MVQMNKRIKWWGGIEFGGQLGGSFMEVFITGEDNFREGDAGFSRFT